MWIGSAADYPYRVGVPVKVGSRILPLSTLKTFYMSPITVKKSKNSNDILSIISVTIPCPEAHGIRAQVVVNKTLYIYFNQNSVLDIVLVVLIQKYPFGMLTGPYCALKHARDMHILLWTELCPLHAFFPSWSDYQILN